MAVNYLDGTLKHTRALVGIHVRGHKGKQAKCVGDALRGKTYKPTATKTAREQVHEALATASENCGK